MSLVKFPMLTEKLHGKSRDQDCSLEHQSSNSDANHSSVF